MKVLSALILVAVAASAAVSKSENLEKQFLDNSQYYFPGSGSSDNYSYPSWLQQPFPVYVPESGNNYYQQPYFGGFQPRPSQNPFFGPGFGGPSYFDEGPSSSPFDNMQFSFGFGFRKPRPSFDWASLLNYLNRPIPVPEYPQFGDYWNQPLPVYTIPAPAPVTYPNPFTTEVYYPTSTYRYNAPAAAPAAPPTAYTTTYRPTMYTTTARNATTYRPTTYSPLVPMVTNFYGQWVPAPAPAAAPSAGK